MRTFEICASNTLVSNVLLLTVVTVLARRPTSPKRDFVSFAQYFPIPLPPQPPAVSVLLYFSDIYS